MEKEGRDETDETEQIYTIISNIIKLNIEYFFLYVFVGHFSEPE